MTEPFFEQLKTMEPRLLIDAFEALNQLFWLQLSGPQSATYLSGVLRKLTGYSAEMLQSQPLIWLANVLPEDRSHVSELLTHPADKHTHNLNFRLKTASGIVWLKAQHRCLKLDDKRRLNLLLMHDITAEREAESELMSLVQRRQVILDHIGEGVAVVDRGGQLLSLNSAAKRLLGTNEPDSGPESWSEHFGLFQLDNQNTLALDESPLQRALKGELVRNCEVYVRSERVKPTTLLVTATPLRDERGEITGAVSVFRDITALHLAEEKLRQTSDRLRYVFERFSQGFMTLNKDWQVTFFNRAAWEIIGRISPSEVMRRDFWQLFPDTAQTDRVFTKEFNRAVYEQVDVHFSEYLPGMDLWLEINAYPYQNELHLFFQDITEARRHEQLLLLEKEMYADISRSELPLNQSLNHALTRLGQIFPDRCFALLRLSALEDQLALVLAPNLSTDLSHRWELNLTQSQSLWTDWFHARPADLYWEPGSETGPLDPELSLATGKGVRLLPVSFKQGQLIAVLAVFYHQTPWAERGHELRFYERAAALFGNLTEVWLAEWQLRLSTERNDLVSLATNDAIWDWDLQAHTLKWNPAIETLFGYQPGQINNRIDGWYMNIHPEDRDRVMHGIHEHIARGSSRWQDEYRFRHFDGTYSYVLNRGYLLLDAQDEPVRMIGAMQDITQLKQHEQQILAQNQHLLEIAWKQSHEVRRPLANLLGLIEILEVDDSSRKLLQHLRNEAETLDCIIQDIVASSEQVLKSGPTDGHDTTEYNSQSV